MQVVDSLDVCIDLIVARLGKVLRVGVPIGIGKPVPLLNALYRRALRDPELTLHLYTALSLSRPVAKSELEARIMNPVLERLLGDCPELEYEVDRVAERLPSNVRVFEFYFQPGKYLHLTGPQQDYISSNYTHVARDLAARGVNLLLGAVAVRGEGGERRLSLSSNPDVSLDLERYLDDGRELMVVCQTNGQLPYLYGDAEVPSHFVDILVHQPALDHALFATPREPVTDADMAIGLYVSSLIKDGGDLQIGIGSLGDAVAHALCLRQRDNLAYRRVLEDLELERRDADLSSRLGGLAPFERGLSATTEMFVDAYQALWEANVLRRRVYEDVFLQRLLSVGEVGEIPSERHLLRLLAVGAIASPLRERDVAYLQRFGILSEDLRWREDSVIAADGRRLGLDLTDSAQLAELGSRGLGQRLRGGTTVRAGFLVGNPGFYRFLRELSEPERERIGMFSIHRINHLYGHEELDRAQRTHARFVNTAMMVTLSGAVVSDGLEDGRVVSGVGGQYNFVAMAHELEGACSIIQVRATRTHKGVMRSNILPHYGHTTVPRHLRDVVVTEYGVAALRGKTDREVIEALIAVADSRFQPDLVRAAKQSGKLPASYEVPEAFQYNVPEQYSRVLSAHRSERWLGRYPLGSELTEVEDTLAQALTGVQEMLADRAAMVRFAAEAARGVIASPAHRPYLERMGLDAPRGLRETLYRAVVVAALRRFGIG